jgi:hypothetical protein
VDSSIPKDLKALQARLEQEREKLNGFVRDLRAVDGELERLGPERKQYRLLHLACGALEELSELGAGRLFFGGGDAGGAEQLRVVRGRVDAFDKRLAEIQERREGVVDELNRQQEVVELLEEELFDLERQEELRREEWIVEREASALPARELLMPWARGGEDDRRLRRALLASLLASLLLMLLIPRIPLPLRELGEEPARVPERLTRLLMEARPLPPAPPREAVPQQPQQLAAQEPPETAPQAAKPSDEGPGKGAGEGTGEGPAQGPGKGILAFREQFSGFRETQNVARLGAQARISNPAAAASGRSERAMVTTHAPGSSGGINLAALSRGVGGSGAGGGGGQLAGVQVARATSTIAGGGSGGRGAGGSGSGNGPPLGRTDEEIQIVFDRHKAALYRLYNRELRNDPTLQGQMVLRIRIEPDGSVSLCDLQATDMKAPQLVAQVLERVRSFDFGAKDVPALTILYPIDFLPAT